MTRLARPLHTLQSRYDVIVIGSGYGGGVTASRLSRAGKRVAVLERGREFVTGEFPGRFPDLKNELQVTAKRVRTGSPTGLFDVRVGDDMHILVGCGLGGGSLVNAGVTLRPDARVFADEVWPGQIAQDGLLDEGFRRAERWIRPQSHARALEMTKCIALDAAGKALGRETVAPPIAISFDGGINAAGIDQPACTLCGDCCGGCNVGAKNTVALTYLPDAVRHGAELFAEIKVDRIEKARDGGWRVHTLAVGDEAPRILEAPVVVVAAGTLGSSEILLRSRAHGLTVSDRVGQGFSANGDIIAFGYGAKAPINAVGIGHPAKIEGREIGASVSGQLEYRDPDNLDNELRVQEGVMPSALAPVLPLLFVPNGRLLGALKSLIAGVYNGPFAHLQTYFAVSHDSASGRFTLEDDRLRLSWPGAKDEPVYQRLDQALQEIVAHGGGQYVKNPLAGTVMGHQPATAHPLGGCGMGRDATTGVVNHKCQVFDASQGSASTAVHEGLYVIDGSVMPRSLGVNPLLTITAISERAMLHFAADHGLTFDDAPVSAPSVSVFAPGSVAA
jgi:cholesterol oxidase